MEPHPCALKYTSWVFFNAKQFAELSYRCQRSIPTNPSATFPAQFLSEAPQVTTCQGALDNYLVENGRGRIFNLRVLLGNQHQVGGAHRRWRTLTDASHKQLCLADLLFYTAAGLKWEMMLRFWPEIHILSQYNYALRSMKPLNKQSCSIWKEMSYIRRIIDQMIQCSRKGGTSQFLTVPSPDK